MTDRRSAWKRRSRCFGALGETVPNAASRATQMLTNLSWIAIRQGDFVTRASPRGRIARSTTRARVHHWGVGHPVSPGTHLPTSRAIAPTPRHFAGRAWSSHGTTGRCSGSSSRSTGSRSSRLRWDTTRRRPASSAPLSASTSGSAWCGTRPCDAGRDHALSGVRTRLGEEGFASAWAAGRALPVEDAVVEADASRSRAGQRPRRAVQSTTPGSQG